MIKSLILRLLIWVPFTSACFPPVSALHLPVKQARYQLIALDIYFTYVYTSFFEVQCHFNALLPSPSQRYRKVCYYTNWAQYRPSRGKYLPENVDPNLCTHVIYAFAKLLNMKLAPFEWNDDSVDSSKGL